MVSAPAHAQKTETARDLAFKFYGYGDYPQALSFFYAHLNAKPADGEAWQFTGFSHIGLGQPSSALKAFDKALSTDAPKNVSYLGISQAYRQMKKPKKALEKINQALLDSPSYAEGWNERGVAQQELGLYKQAISSYSKAIELKPNYASALSNRGAARYYNQNIEAPTRQDILKAIEDFSLAIAADSNLCMAHRNRGLAWSYIDSFSLALPDLKRSWNCGKGLVNGLSYAHALTQRGDYNKALDILAEAAAQNPDDGNLAIEMASAKIGIRYFQEGLDDLQRADQVFRGKNPGVNFVRARLYAAQGSYLQMLNELEQARRKGFFMDARGRKALAAAKEFDEFRGQPEFQAFVQRVSLGR